MAILWYEEQKREWLSSHPDVRPADYRKARGFKKLQNLGRFRRFLPAEQRHPNREIIEHNTTWSEEEIFAQQHYQEELEDKLVEQLEEDIAVYGYHTNKEGLIKLHKHINKEEDKLLEHFTTQLDKN